MTMKIMMSKNDNGDHEENYGRKMTIMMYTQVGAPQGDPLGLKRDWQTGT